MKPTNWETLFAACIFLDVQSWPWEAGVWNHSYMASNWKIRCIRNPLSSSFPYKQSPILSGCLFHDFNLDWKSFELVRSWLDCVRLWRSERIALKITDMKSTPLPYPGDPTKPLKRTQWKSSPNGRHPIGFDPTAFCCLGALQGSRSIEEG